MNYLQIGDDFTEDTLLYPTRKRIVDIAVGILGGTRETVSGSCAAAPQDFPEWLDFLSENPEADTVNLGRIEALRNNGWQVSTIYVGIQRKRDSLEDGFIPFDGVEVADLIDLGKLLHEVKTAKEMLGLTCLEQNTLINTSIARYAPTPLP